MIANPLPNEIDEKVKDSIMKNRQIILSSVKKGLNKLAEYDETYDEKTDSKVEENEAEFCNQYK